jgi:hypothetical protein
VLNNRALPINAMIEIPGGDPDLKSFFEWHGWTATHITPHAVTMRRDFASGILADSGGSFDPHCGFPPVPEPRRPASFAKVCVLQH